MLLHYGTTLGKLMYSFQRFCLCHTRTLRSSAASSPIHRRPSIVSASADYLHWTQLPLLLGICLDNGFRPNALLTQRMHFHFVSRRNLSHIERNVKLHCVSKNGEVALAITLPNVNRFSIVCSGVRQGAVWSPFMYAIYIDKVGKLCYSRSGFFVVLTIFC